LKFFHPVSKDLILKLGQTEATEWEALMDFSQAFKVFELNLLRQIGVTVTPQQVGLKSDPIADLKAKNATSAFGTILGNLTGTNTTASASPPQPPTPPTDTTDQAAMLKYQQDLLTYNQSYQLYNQQFMRLLLTQLQSVQQSVIASQNNTANANSSSSNSPIATGGILD
jgi:hypothetical protein